MSAVDRRCLGLFLTVTLGVCAGAAPCPAQDKPRPGLLGERFFDGSFGFSIRPFAQARVNRHKAADPLGGYQLVEFVHRTRPWVLLVHLDRTRQPMRPEEFVDALRSFWARRYKGIETRGRSTRNIAARKGAVWNGSYKEISGTWSMFEAVVQIGPDEFFRVTLKVPDRDRITAWAMFEVIVDSFEMVHSDVSLEMLDRAQERGRKLLNPDEPLDFSGRTDPDAYVLVRRSGRDLGFAHIQESVETRNGKEGLRVKERGWLFFEEGLFRHIRNDYFVSGDLKSEMFEMRLRTVTLAADGRPAMVTEQLERGIRENDKLVLSYTEEPGDLALTNEVLEVTGTYIPLGLLRMLPRIVPLDRPDIYAFSSYNSEHKGLVMRTFRVLGPLGPDAAGDASVAYRVEDSEGMTPPVSEIFLDDRGLARRIIAGDDRMIRTTEAKVLYLFGQRLRQARDLMTELGFKVDR